jgi:hypothetical protein
MDKASGTVKHFLSSLNSIEEWLASFQCSHNVMYYETLHNFYD